MSAETAPELPSKLLIDIDDVSVGFYGFPVATIEGVAAARRTTIVADNTGGAYNLPGLVCPVPADLRFRPPGEPPMRSYKKAPRNLAWAFFLNALPSFWLSRFRIRDDLKQILDANSGTIDLLPLLNGRKKQRQNLSLHADSLKQRTWALRYHRARFLEHIDKAGEGLAASLFVTTCELNAIESTLYGLLDEVALTMNRMAGISSGEMPPQNFSSLRCWSRLRPEFKRLFDNMSWYEAFHLRRTGAAHAFTPRVVAETENDIRLFCHPPPRYATQTTTTDYGDAKTLVQDLSRQVDVFLADLAVLLLAYFHCCDVVTMVSRKDTTENPVADSIWTREVSFTDKIGSEQYLDPVTGDAFMTYIPE